MIRNLFLLAGAALLVAGCSNGVTSPANARPGGSAASAKAPPTVPTSTNSTNSTSSSTDGECRSGYTVSSGRTDSVCMDDIQ